MSVRFQLACAVLCLALPSQGMAAKNVTVVRQPSLLMFGPVSHGVAGTYTLSQHSASGSTSTAQSASERYLLQTSLAVLDPDLLSADISAGAAHQKEYSDNGGSSLNMQYNIRGTGLVSSPTPFSFSTSQYTSFVANGYVPSYSITNNNNLVTIRLQNEIVPLQFSYGRGKSSTSGLVKDYSSVTDSMWLGGSFTRERSTTSASVGSTSDRSAGRDSKNFRVSLNNSSTLDQKRKYLLNTVFSLNHSKPVDVTNKTLTFSESLSAKLGAALSGGLAYQFTDSSTVDFSGQSQEQAASLFSGSLTHRLFQSLTTTVAASYDDSRAFGGRSKSFSESIALAYTKQLLPGNRLGLNTSFTRRTTDQELLATEIAVRDEQYRVTQQGEFFTPRQPGTLSGVVSVLNADPALPPYAENVDYRVDLVLGRIEIVVGGSIAPGSDLLVSYRVAVNPDIKYISDFYSTGFVLSLLSNRYMVSGNVSASSASLVSGSASQTPLAESISYNLRGDANYGALKTSAEYLYSDNSSQAFSKVSVSSTYSYSPNKSDLFGFNVADNYYMYPGSDTGGSSYGENTLTASASYSGLLWQSLRTTASLAGTDSRSRFGQSNTFMTRLSVSWNFREISISADGSNLYRITSATTARDSSLVINVARSF